MLEKTAACLESGSRRLSPTLRKLAKSRRGLHSSFWNHGVGDLEFSPLWAMLVQEAASTEQATVPYITSGTFLDFLYPIRTLGLLRNFSGWAIDRQDMRLTNHSLRKHCYRQYTSSSKIMPGFEDKPILREPSTKSSDQTRKELGDTERELTLLREKMALSSLDDYDDVWWQYTQFNAVDQKELRKLVIYYLGQAPTVRKNAERITLLFKEMNADDKDANTFLFTIQAYLRLKKLTEALRIHRLAAAKLEILLGCDQIMGCLGKKSLWPEAWEFWQELQARKSYMTMLGSTDVFRILDKNIDNGVPGLRTRLTSLVEYVKKSLSAVSTQEHQKLIHFAARIIQRALLSTSLSEASNKSTVLVLLKALRGWQQLTPDFIDRLLGFHKKMKQRKLIEIVYSLVRRINGFRPSEATLYIALDVFCTEHDVLGMKQVVDDFFTHHTAPSPIVYRICMREFAGQGDAASVHALFAQFLERFEKKAQDFAPLLHVHAKRGEVAVVERIFNQIKDIHRLEPSIICWNILLSAYAKVQDIDKAYLCFDRILNNPESRPDHYTLGTMMGLCALRGDLQRATEVYELSTELEIQPSAAMVADLVLCHIRNDNLEEAEKICEQPNENDTYGSRTRMWNYLIVAYAQRRDTINSDRILRKMSANNVTYDEYTYAALMQTLSMTRRPDQAYKIMKEELPAAGFTPNNFHFAVLMGGFILIQRYEMVFKVQKLMLDSKIRNSASTNILAMKAAAFEDAQLFANGTTDEKIARALAIFSQTISMLDPRDISHTARKGAGQLPLNIAYPTMLYSFVTLLLSKNDQTEVASDLLVKYMAVIPVDQRDRLPIQILTSMISNNHAAGNHDGVQDCWERALAFARHTVRPLPSVCSAHRSKDPVSKSSGVKIAYFHRLMLNAPFTFYMQNKAAQKKIGDLTTAVKHVVQDGFVLDNVNWNLYISLLARSSNYSKLAFQLCETRLMPGWKGWAKVRWNHGVGTLVSRTSRTIGNQGIDTRHMRVWDTTLLWLSRRLIKIRELAIEDTRYEMLLHVLELECPATLAAIRTMPYTNNENQHFIIQADNSVEL